MARRKQPEPQTVDPELPTFRDEYAYDPKEDVDFIKNEMTVAEAQPEPEQTEQEKQPKKSAIEKLKARYRAWTEKNGSKEQKEAAQLPRPLRIFLRFFIAAILLFVIICMILTHATDISFFQLPEKGVTEAMTPVQNGFSSFTDIFIDYMRKLKLRSELEKAYEQVVTDNEELTYKALLADELQIQLAQYENMSDEVKANSAMNPLVCRIIGRTDGNYFSTFTINRGRRDGIEDFMAVTISGALVGYVESVSETEAQVRTIIDSEASIAGLIQSSRDQGTVRGTLGIDGTAMCRMYYLPDNSLPRPGDVVVTSGVGMSFPKGIPIGVVRESTRGMESNKSYVVVEPNADFQHLEYVIVLRYQPSAQAVQGRTSASYNEFVPTETARPYPTLQMFSSSFYSSTATPVPEGYLIATDTPEPTAVETATPTPRPTPTATPEDTSPVIEYQQIVEEYGPTISPSPSPSPSPTPRVTIDPQNLTIEEDD